MIIRVPVLTCKVCKCQFARSRRVVLPTGKTFTAFERKAKFCSHACRQRDYRMRKACKSVGVTHPRASVTIA